MADQNKSSSPSQKVIILVILAVLVIGGLAYVSGQLADESRHEEATTTQDMASSEETVTESSAEPIQDVDVADSASEETETPVVEAVEAPKPAEPMEIKPGNPVVAKVGDQEIKRQDVLNAMRLLSPQTQQLPIETLFPLVQNQVVSMAIVEKRAEKSDLADDPAVQEQLETAKKQIIRNIYMERAVEEALTEERLKGAYDEYVQNFPKMEEAHAYHILVEDEKLAEDLIKQINEGADFAELAKEHSIDPTGQEGGDLGYFSAKDVVPEFSDAAFAQEIGVISEEPVQSQYGYHIIKVVDVREKEPAPYEQVKPLLEAQLRQVVMKEKLNEWQKNEDVTLFDINGEAMKQNETEPAAGE